MLMTLDELNQKVDTMYLSTQKERYGWNSLSENDKSAILNQANMEFNRFQYIGFKVDDAQADAFPRKIYNTVVETPDDVKNSITVYCMDMIRYLTDDTIEDLRKGVNSVHIGNYSESYNLDKYKSELTTYKKYLSNWIYRGNWKEKGWIP